MKLKTKKNFLSYFSRLSKEKPIQAFSFSFEVEVEMKIAFFDLSVNERKLAGSFVSIRAFSDRSFSL